LLFGVLTGKLTLLSGTIISGMDFNRKFSSVPILSLFISPALIAAPAFHVQMSLAQEDIQGNSNTVQRLSAAMRYSKSIASNRVLNLNADLYHQVYPDISSWNSDGFLLEAIYNWVPTPGFTRPMYSLLLRHEKSTSDWFGADFSQSSVILADNFRLDDRQSLSFGVELARRSQGAEDASLVGLFANSDITINDNLLFYLNLKLQQQDNGKSYGGLNVVDSLRLRAYPATESGKIVNRFFTIGANYSINAHHSFDLSYQSVKYDFNGDGSDYTLVSFDYFYKF
jgi:hypothetical protein